MTALKYLHCPYCGALVEAWWTGTDNEVEMSCSNTDCAAEWHRDGSPSSPPAVEQS